MSIVTIYQEDQPDEIIAQVDDMAVIVEALSKLGVRYERWDTKELSDNMSDNEVLEAYSSDIERLKDEGGYKSVDVIRLSPDSEQKCELRKKFLCEHIHSEDEVRFFVEGSGMFYLHIEDKVYMMLCQSGDLLCVPKGAKHWFDMGADPHFTCIRIFTSPDGWAAEYTGNDIADNFPKFDKKAA